MSKTTAQKAAQKAAKAVATAYRSSLGGGNYGPAIAARSIAAAYRSSLKGGNYGPAIARKMETELNQAAFDALGGVVMNRRKKRAPLTPAQKAARKRVLSAHKASAARAARLPGGKKKPGGKKLSAAEKSARARVLKARKTYAANAAKAARLNGKKRSKKPAAAKATAPAARRAQKPKGVKNVTADSVIKAAAQTALKRWACQGPRRSGCGAGGSRVVDHPKNLASLVRIRPPRFMTAG